MEISNNKAKIKRSTNIITKRVTNTNTTMSMSMNMVHVAMDHAVMIINMKNMIIAITITTMSKTVMTMVTNMLPSPRRLREQRKQSNKGKSKRSSSTLEVVNLKEETTTTMMMMTISSYIAKRKRAMYITMNMILCIPIPSERNRKLFLSSQKSITTITVLPIIMVSKRKGTTDTGTKDSWIAEQTTYIY